MMLSIDAVLLLGVIVKLISNGSVTSDEAISAESICPRFVFAILPKFSIITVEV